MSETKTYIETIAKIESTYLGFEDHGIFTFVLHLNYGGAGQGAGFYNISGPNCANYLKGVLRACGVDSWEKLKGRTILALTEERNGTVVGIAPLPTEKGSAFLWAEATQ